MDFERAQELVVLAGALAVGVLLAVVDPERMPERVKSWALNLGKFRQPIGLGIILVVIALAVFR
jgi:ABC-type tungstate transport system substrate-binding protein